MELHRRNLLNLGLGLLGGTLSACFAGTSPAPSPGITALDPDLRDVEGWQIQRYDAEVGTCPDGQTPRLYIVHPTQSDAAAPLAVVLHGGTLDARDPALHTPSHLERDWAVRRVFARLGMSDDGDAETADGGALAVALAEQGVASVFATNCWGDLWHNEVAPDEDTGRENDLDADGFERDGYALARHAWRIAADTAYAAEIGFELPVAVDRTRLLLIGLGHGGRGAAELLEDGYAPSAVAVDSAPDDLTAYWDGDPALYADTVTVLERVFPGGRDTVAAGSLAAAPLPGRVAYVYSSLDPAIPAASHASAIAVVGGLPDGWVLDAGTPGHVVTAGDLDAARLLVAHLLDTEPIQDDPADTGSR